MADTFFIMTFSLKSLDFVGAKNMQYATFMQENSAKNSHIDDAAYESNKINESVILSLNPYTKSDIAPKRKTANIIARLTAFDAFTDSLKSSSCPSSTDEEVRFQRLTTVFLSVAQHSIFASPLKTTDAAKTIFFCSFVGSDGS